MRILLAHNYYQQPGGEDKVFACEASLLESNGHQVVRYTQHNDSVAGMPLVKLAAKTVWNRSTYRELRQVIRRERPDVCHFHNTFPLMSPAVFHAARHERIPVVVTLHNYRLLCPAYTFMREGSVCEKCASKPFAWPGIVHACYRGSRPASAIAAGMLAAHRVMGTWSQAVDVYVALTEFARRKFVKGGLPAAKVVVKQNSLDHDPGYSADRGDHALFVGRLAPEKGIETLLSAWQLIKSPLRLRIAGDGPLADRVARAAREDSRIEWLGTLSSEQVVLEMKRANVLICPSIWYEGLPLTLIEAFATGLPAIASRIGGLPDVVTEGQTGLMFSPGEPAELAAQVEWAARNPAEVRRMGGEARRSFEKTYTADTNYRLLMKVYRRALSGKVLLVDRERPQLAAVERDVAAANHAAGGGSA
jgi:glycosyltransferase involved in cell wall biosynthesis